MTDLFDIEKLDVRWERTTSGLSSATASSEEVSRYPSPPTYTELKAMLEAELGERYSVVEHWVEALEAPLRRIEGDGMDTKAQQTALELLDQLEDVLASVLLVA